VRNPRIRWSITRSRHDGSPTTPNPTLKVEVLVRTPPTITSCREEDSVLRKLCLLPHHRDRNTFVYHESRKRDLKTRPVYEGRCDERLKTKTEKSTRLPYTGLLGELEHLKIKTRLKDEMFVSVML
jgi:hypothetical protein